MTTEQTILFDMDDTLIYCNKFFDLVIEQFADLMGTWFRGYGLNPEEIKRLQAEIDLNRVLKEGFSPRHFPQSFLDTYTHYSKMTGRTESSSERNELLELGRSVYGHSIEPYPHMEQTLLELERDGHKLHLYTGGDPEVQLRKVRDAGLERFFGSRIHVTRHKTTEFMKRLIESERLDRSRTWMVGNSLRTDIIPALKNGIHAIYMPAEQEWAYNIVEVDTKPAGAFYTLSSLKLVPGTIRSYVSGNTKDRNTSPAPSNTV